MRTSSITIVPFPSHHRLEERMRKAELAAAAGYWKQTEAALRRAENGDANAIAEVMRLTEGILFHANSAQGGAHIDRELNHILAARENRRA